MKQENIGNFSHQNVTSKKIVTNKRFRISFVCQACRKSKTKCGKEKPQCERCLKNGLSCVYDIEQQHAPRVPNKDATIKRLTRELEYWQNKAMSYINLNDSPRDNKINQELDIKASNCSFLDTNNVVPTPGNIKINFYKSNPQLFIKNSMKRDIKPASDMAQIRQDKFLSTFFASIFSSTSDGALLNTLPDDGISPHVQNLKLRQNAKNLRAFMLNKCKNDIVRERIIQFTENIIEGNNNKEFKTTFFSNFFSSILSYNFIEDCCPNGVEYSNHLQELILKVELFLPPLEIIKKYRLYFYKYVYPIIPFLDIELFEESLNVIFEFNSENYQLVKLNMGKDNIRERMENVAILLVILKITYITINFAAGQNSYTNIDGINLMKQYPISDEAISISQNILASVNIFEWTNENCLTCLMYLWAFFIFTPEFGDFYLGQPTDILLSIINSLALKIGLHRDPSVYAQLQDPSVCDPRLSNYRRKLWLAIVTVCRYEASLKGRYPQAMRENMRSFIDIGNNSESYMDMVMSDMSLKDPFSVLIHSYSFKRYQLFLLISELDSVSIDLTKSVPLSEVDSTLTKIRDFLGKHFPISDLKYSDTEEKFTIPFITENHEYFDPGVYSNTICFEVHMVSKLIILRTNNNLFLHFENLCATGENKYFHYYQKYFINTIKEVLELSTILRRYLKGEYNYAFSFAMKYSTDKTAQLCIPTILYTFLGIILRVILAKSILSNKIQDAELFYPSPEMISLKSEIDQKLILFATIKKNFESLFESFCYYVSKELRSTYLSIFKLLIFFDNTGQIIKKGEVLNVLSKITKIDFPRKLRDKIYLAFGIDPNKKDELIQSLKNLNHLPFSDIQTLQHIINISNNQLHDQISLDISSFTPIDNNSLSINHMDNPEKFLPITPTFIPTSETTNMDIGMTANKDGIINNQFSHEIEAIPDLFDKDFSLDGFDFFDYEFLLDGST